MYRLMTAFLILISVAYGMQNVVHEEKLPVAFDKIKLELKDGVKVVTEMCEKIGELCQDTWDNPSNYRCKYSHYFAEDQSAVFMKFDIIREADNTLVCAFKYNMQTEDLTRDDNPDFLWKIKYKKN